MTIKQLPESERPYEKLQIYGEKSLSNSELLAIIIKTGNKENTSIDLANRILNLKGKNNCNDLRFLQDVSLEEFMSIKGIGKVKAIQLKAMCELAKRMSKPIEISKLKIKSSQDVAELLMEELRYERREIIKVIILNIKNNILKIQDVAFGSSNFVNITPKEIFIEAVKMNAPKIIVVHNHPSGDPTPSMQDIEMTKKIILAGDVMKIQLLDHIIIGDGIYESIFSKKGLWSKQ